MAITAPGTPSAPAEKPDPAAAKQGGAGDDRPGFDLGGAKDRAAGAKDDAASPPGSNLRPGGPADPAPAGSQSADTPPKGA